MLSTCWEAGLSCVTCSEEIPLGSEMLYGKHLACARSGAQQRRRDAGEAEDVVEVAQRKLAAKGRIVLTSSQLRELVTRSGVKPVHRPDMGAGRIAWYGRLTGWDPARVERGLDAEHVAGLWLDHLNVGRMPPIKHLDLSQILEAIGNAASYTPHQF